MNNEFTTISLYFVGGDRKSSIPRVEQEIML
jgi:hypothetical protein